MRLLGWIIICSWIMAYYAPATARAEVVAIYPDVTYHYSRNRRYQVRIDTVKPEFKYRITLRKRRANRWKRIWSRRSPWKQAPPNRVYVSDDGRHVVLRDQYGGVGRGTVLFLLASRGRIIKGLSLRDFLSDKEWYRALERVSVSSTWWDRTGIAFLRPNNHHFVIVTDIPRIIVLDLTTGAIVTVTQELRQAVLAEARAWVRDDLAGETGSDRRIAVRLSYLADRSAVKTLEGMLADSEHGTVFEDGERHQRYALRLRAGAALVRLLGVEAVPLLQGRLKDANPYMRGEWKELIEQAQTAGASGGR